MDVDVEIISEDGDCPDPLFNSIMNAMNSMKEATADKIYQKIQREGENNYSKPQVERALANALNYGIFEVRNNRYRIRDDILDDEGTVYWKLDKKRMQTPFGGQDGSDPPTKGSKLDPERDQKRFVDIKKMNGCLKCGKAKRARRAKCMKHKRVRHARSRRKHRKCGKKRETRESRSPKCSSVRERKCAKRRSRKRRCQKRRKRFRKSRNRCSKSRRLRRKIREKRRKCKARRKHRSAPKPKHCPRKCSYLNTPFDEPSINVESRGHPMLGNGTCDISDTEMDLLASPMDQGSLKNYRDNVDRNFRDKYKDPRSMFSSEYDESEEFGNSNAKKLKSKDSLKSETYTEKSGLSSASNRTATPSLSGLNLPSTSKNEKERSQFLAPGGMYDGDQNNKCNEKTDWMSYSDEPQTAIIQTKNVLTIEPMDSLTLKSLDHTSYVS